MRRALRTTTDSRERRPRFSYDVFIVAIGASHVGTSLPVLERLSIPPSALHGILAQLKPIARESFVLSTCNRTEIYAVIRDDLDVDAIRGVLAGYSGMRLDELQPHLAAHIDDDAARHALRVASGMVSMVLGEDQIQAQWKRAVATARDAGALGPLLERLAAAALTCGKRVRTLTGIARHAVSLESLAVRAAIERSGALDDRHVVLVGTGESAALIARHLRANARPRMTIVSRSLQNAEAFSAAFDATPRSITDLPELLAGADALFSCTSAPHPIVLPAHLQLRTATSACRPMTCIDLGLPRDIERSVAELPGVSLISLETLAALADAHRAERRSQLPAAERIVEAETHKFIAWRTARDIAAPAARLRPYAGALPPSAGDVQQAAS